MPDQPTPEMQSEPQARHRVTVDVTLLMYAFRYALGRQTYAVSDVADALIDNADLLRPDWQLQIVERIEEAIREGQAGHMMDVQRWREVQETMARLCRA